MIQYLLIISTSALFGLQHSGVSSLRVKNWIIDKYGRQNYANIFTITSIVMFLLAFLSVNFWDWLYFLSPLTFWQTILLMLGIVIGTAGILVATKASSVISVSTVADMRTDRNAELVTDGIYARIRHPLYLATVLVFSGMALIYPFLNVIVFALSMIIYTMIGAFFEERKLILHYGDEYLEYMTQAGFILPRF